MPTSLPSQSRQQENLDNEYVARSGWVAIPINFQAATSNFQDADISGATIADASHTFIDGMRVQVGSTGTLPVPLAIATTYFIVNAVPGVSYQLAATLGGTPISLTGVDAAATHTATEQPLDTPDSLQIVLTHEAANLNRTGFVLAASVINASGLATTPDVSIIITAPTVGLDGTVTHLAFIYNGSTASNDPGGVLDTVNPQAAPIGIIGGSSVEFSAAVEFAPLAA